MRARLKSIAPDRSVSRPFAAGDTESAAHDRITTDRVRGVLPLVRRIVAMHQPVPRGPQREVAVPPVVDATMAPRHAMRNAAAHTLMNPLTPVMIRIHLLKERSDLSPGARESVRLLEASIERLKQCALDIVATARELDTAALNDDPP